MTVEKIKQAMNEVFTGLSIDRQLEILEKYMAILILEVKNNAEKEI